MLFSNVKLYKFEDKKEQNKSLNQKKCQIMLFITIPLFLGPNKRFVSNRILLENGMDYVYHLFRQISTFDYSKWLRCGNRDSLVVDRLC